MINSLVNNFFFHLLINKKQLIPIRSEKKENEIVFLDVSVKEEADSSNMLINFYQNTWLHLPEDNVHTHCHKKFKSGDITHSLTTCTHAPPTPTTHTHTYTLLHTDNYENKQGYSKVPPGFPNSTAQQPRQTRQKGAYQWIENLSKFFFS